MEPDWWGWRGASEAASETCVGAFPRPCCRVRPGLVISEVFTFLKIIKIIYAHCKNRKVENTNSCKESIKSPIIHSTGRHQSPLTFWGISIRSAVCSLPTTGV